MCKGPWSEHGADTGGYYRCNRFEQAKAAGEIDEGERQQAKDRQSVAYYEHCADRFAQHLRAQQSASKHLLQTVNHNMMKLQDKNYTLMDLQFALDAVAAVQECRRVLKWTYVLLYFSKQGNAKEIFEHQQGQLENFTDRLHEQLADNEASGMDEMTNPMKDTHALFLEWKRKIVNWTNTSQQFMKQFCDAAKDGRTLLGFEDIGLIEGEARRKAGGEEDIAFVDGPDVPVGWACNACTFWNEDMSLEFCSVCMTPRGAIG
jgi:hypothetical protein